MSDQSRGIPLPSHLVEQALKTNVIRAGFTTSVLKAAGVPEEIIDEGSPRQEVTFLLARDGSIALFIGGQQMDSRVCLALGAQLPQIQRALTIHK